METNKENESRSIDLVERVLRGSVFEIRKGEKVIIGRDPSLDQDKGEEWSKINQRMVSIDGLVTPTSLSRASLEINFLEKHDESTQPFTPGIEVTRLGKNRIFVKQIDSKNNLLVEVVEGEPQRCSTHAFILVDMGKDGVLQLSEQDGGTEAISYEWKVLSRQESGIDDSTMPTVSVTVHQEEKGENMDTISVARNVASVDEARELVNRMEESDLKMLSPILASLPSEVRNNSVFLRGFMFKVQDLGAEPTTLTRISERLLRMEEMEQQKELLRRRTEETDRMEKVADRLERAEAKFKKRFSEPFKFSRREQESGNITGPSQIGNLQPHGPSMSRGPF